MNIVTTTRVALVGALFATAILGSSGRAHAEDVCDLGFMPNKPVIGVGSIIGSAWASCDVPPEQHQMRLALEMRQGGQWVGIEMISDNTIPRTGRHPYTVKARCQPGMWRVDARAVGKLRGNPFDFADTSAERIVSAAECARGDN